MGTMMKINRTLRPLFLFLLKALLIRITSNKSSSYSVSATLYISTNKIPVGRNGGHAGSITTNDDDDKDHGKGNSNGNGKENENDIYSDYGGMLYDDDIFMSSTSEHVRMHHNSSGIGGGVGGNGNIGNSSNINNSSNSSNSSSISNMIRLSFPTLPAQFGKYMLDDRTYIARLQYLPENPYLCRSEPHNSFRPSVGLILPATPPSAESSQNDASGTTANISSSASTTSATIHVPGDPILLLVARGNCPFYEKAVMAEKIDPSIQFIAIYNNDEDGDDALVPMYSEFGETRLVVLSISHGTGQALKHYLYDYYETLTSANITDFGSFSNVAVNGVNAENTKNILMVGPQIELDSITPPGMMVPGPGTMMFGAAGADQVNPQDVVVTAMGLFFLMLSFVGCMLVFIATYGNLRVSNDGQVIFVMTSASAIHSNNSINLDENGNVGGTSTDVNMNGVENRSVGSVFGVGSSRRLLTIDEVNRLQQQQQPHPQHASHFRLRSNANLRSNIAASSASAATTASTTDNSISARLENNNDNNNNRLRRNKRASAARIDEYADNDLTFLPDDNDNDGHESSGSGDSNSQYSSCAICLGDDLQELDYTTDVVQLPCHHAFHYGCITTWLTERQSKCPLCKFDVLAHVRTPTNNNSTSSNTGTDSTDNNNTNRQQQEEVEVGVVYDGSSNPNGRSPLRSYLSRFAITRRNQDRNVGGTHGIIGNVAMNDPSVSGSSWSTSSDEDYDEDDNDGWDAHPRNAASASTVAPAGGHNNANGRIGSDTNNAVGLFNTDLWDRVIRSSWYGNSSIFWTPVVNASPTLDHREVEQNNNHTSQRHQSDNDDIERQQHRSGLSLNNQLPLYEVEMTAANIQLRSLQ